MRRMMLVVMAVGAMACGGEESAARGIECWEPAYDPEDPDFSLCVPDPDPEAGSIQCVPLDASQGQWAAHRDHVSDLPCEQRIWRLESVWKDDVAEGVLLAGHKDERAYLLTLVCDCP